mgnify:CR=1 FL=1
MGPRGEYRETKHDSHGHSIEVAAVSQPLLLSLLKAALLLRTVQTLIYDSRKAFDDGTEHCIEQQLKFLLLCG